MENLWLLEFKFNFLNSISYFIQIKGFRVAVVLMVSMDWMEKTEKMGEQNVAKFIENFQDVRKIEKNWP